MRIVFIGTVALSKKALEKLIDMQVKVVGVCTKEKSSFNSDFVDLTPTCHENDIPYIFVEDINAQETIAWIKARTPDIIFCFGWSSLLKKELLHLAPLGVVGFHPAKLPQNRGRHPLIWALALGLKESASTFFFMREGVDDGDVLSQKDFVISDEDDAQSLYTKVTNLAMRQIEEFVPALQSGTYQRVAQKHNEANVWRKRGKRDGTIDFRMASRAIYNLVRALSKPYVGAHFVYKEKEIVVYKAQIIKNNTPNIESGKVLESTHEYIVVKTYDGAIKLFDYECIELPKVGEYL
ncbi:MAG: formyltransferase family protein [Sulfurimonas sp.]|jgi:methionyl-tRNA formyltransferase|nr:formyltransferase family protein [Sulfurimonas sp.]